MTATAMETAVVAKYDARRHEIARFDDYRLRAYQLLRQAETIAINADLGDIQIQQVRSSGVIAGSTFHTIYGRPDGPDFIVKKDDLDVVCMVDGLIEAIGADAHANCPAGISDKDFADCFQSVTRNAIDGNASFLLDRCAEAVSEDAAHDGHRQAAE